MPTPDMACEALLHSGITQSLNTNLKTLHTRIKGSKTFPVNWEVAHFLPRGRINPGEDKLFPQSHP